MADVEGGVAMAATKTKETYDVTVEKEMLCSGTVKVVADNCDDAVAKVDAMILEDKLRTVDVEWGEPEYVDFTFQTTGDVS